MIAALDSATPPSAASVEAARKQGVAMWNGYIATIPASGLAHPWSVAEFTTVKALPAQPIGYASGWDDPVRCRQRADAWGIKLCLDVEPGIRGPGPWVQPWLDASGAGLYGTTQTQSDYRAPWRVLAYYPAADPGRTWLGPAPAVPHGWQWQNSHSEFGVTVDRCWFDDWFGPAAPPMTNSEDSYLQPIIFYAPAAGGGNAAFLSNGCVSFRHIRSPQELRDTTAIIAAVNGKPPYVWDGGNPVADPGAFGVPANAETAQVLGWPFP